MTDMTVSKTILEQLGGNKFIVMTGAKNFVGGNNTLSFRLPGGAGFCKEGINGVRVTLTAMDDYTVEFIKIRKFEVKTIKTVEGVYCDNLQAVFTEATGLYTSLGTMKG